jgi:hypothetical protein
MSSVLKAYYSLHGWLYKGFGYAINADKVEYISTDYNVFLPNLSRNSTKKAASPKAAISY